MSPLTELPDGKAGEVSGILKVLAHPARLRLACRLVAGECSVADMERQLGITQPSLSQHLGALREAGFVTTRREHKLVFYRLTDERVLAIVAALHEIFAGRVRPNPVPLRAGGKTRYGGAAMFAVTGEAV